MAKSERADKQIERPQRYVPFTRIRVPTDNYTLIGALIFFVAAGVYMFLHGGFIGPDTFLLGLLLVALLLGQLLKFLRDWIPFAVIFFGWQLLRGYADNLAKGGGFHMHITEMIDADRRLFGGHIPTVWLQDRLYTPGHLHWYDVGTTMFWAFHFVLPLVFAFFLWVRMRGVYWRFVTCLVVLSFAGFATYVMYPAVPPWIAAYWQYIPPVHLIRAEVLQQLQIGPGVSWVMSHGSPDDYAAMPSLHASYPTLVFWFSLKYWRKVVPLAIAYCLGLWFSIVYIGDHYVVDALAGIGYATVVFWGMHLIFRLVLHYWRARARRIEVREESFIGQA